MSYKPLYGPSCGTRMSNLTVVIDFCARSVKVWQQQTDWQSHCSLPSPTNLTTVLGEEEGEEGRTRGEGRTLSLILTCPESTLTSTSSLHTLPRMPHLESLQVINIPLIDKFNAALQDKEFQKHPQFYDSQELIWILHSRLAPLFHLPRSWRNWSAVHEAKVYPVWKRKIKWFAHTTITCLYLNSLKDRGDYLRSQK